MYTTVYRIERNGRGPYNQENHYRIRRGLSKHYADVDNHPGIWRRAEKSCSDAHLVGISYERFENCKRRWPNEGIHHWEEHIISSDVNLLPWTIALARAAKER